MQVFRSLDSAHALRGCAVAIGNFDGVHLGHRRLFELARERARASGGAAVALTFEPHPVRVLRPQLAPPLLTPLSRKLELLAACGLDAVVVQPFDRGYAGSEAGEFVARDLAGHLGARDVVVGHDFTAGRGRTRVDGLRALLAGHGIALTVVDPVAEQGLVVSSTKIRELLLEGNVEGAAQLLARPHDVDGLVEHGAARGRGIGFATANLRPEAMLPAHGVYAVRAWLLGSASAGGAGRGSPGASGEHEGAAAAGGPLISTSAGGGSPGASGEHEGAAASGGPLISTSAGGGSPGASGEDEGAAASGGPLMYNAVCNVGVKPTVQEGGPVLAEAHLFDFDGRDLHGERMRLAFLARLREERRFASLEALRAQIADDAARARALLAALGPAGSM